MSDYKDTPAIECVTWLDHSANHTGDDFTKSEVKRRTAADVVNRTVGFLIAEDRRKITLAHEARIDVDMVEPRFSHYTTIYKMGILERRKLTDA